MAAPKEKPKGFVETIVETFIQKAVNMFSEPVLNYTGHLCKKASVFLGDFDENMMKLASDLRSLGATCDSLEGAVSIELGNWSGRKSSREVETWQSRERGVRNEANDLIRSVNQEEGRACLGKCCVVRFRYGKKVVTCWEALNKLNEEGCKLMENKEALVEQAAPNQRGRLNNFTNKCSNLRSKIRGIVNLKADVQRKLGARYPPHTISTWLGDVEEEVERSMTCASEGEKHLKDLRKLGSESSSSMVNFVNVDIENEVLECIERIGKHHGVGEKHLDTLSPAGPSAINNEIASEAPAIYA